MRKLVTSVLVTCAFGTAIAQTSSTKVDSVIVHGEDKYKVETNHFFDNWIVGGGAGVQMYFGDHNRQMRFKDQLSPAYNVYLGKWFSPGIGVRLGASGLKFKGVTQNGSHSTGTKYEHTSWDEHRLYNQEVEYYHIHSDVLFNLSNIFAGYREDRFYTISPYVGLGWMFTKNEPKTNEVSANAGLLNTFRLSRVVDLTLDIRGAFINDRFDGEVGGRYGEGLLSTTLGLAFKLPKQGWDRASSTLVKEVDQASYDELNKLKGRVDELLADNDLLRKQLADAKNNEVTDVIVEKNIVVAPILVTFKINRSELSNAARVNLGFLAQAIKDGDSSVVYKVTGYADKGTGTPAINDRLSRERADAVYDCLVNEFGVSPSQLEKHYEGGVENMYYNDPRVSRAVITIAK